MKENYFKDLSNKMGKTEAEKEELFKALKAANEGRMRDFDNSFNKITKLNKSPYGKLWIWTIIGIVFGALIGSLYSIIISTIIFLTIGLIIIKK